MSGALSLKKWSCCQGWENHFEAVRQLECCLLAPFGLTWAFSFTQKAKANATPKCATSRFAAHLDPGRPSHSLPLIGAFGEQTMIVATHWSSKPRHGLLATRHLCKDLATRRWPDSCTEPNRRPPAPLQHFLFWDLPNRAHLQRQEIFLARRCAPVQCMPEALWTMVALQMCALRKA